VWCVPATPYKSTAGALCAIQYARTRPLPFLGTCGGFQHALLEYARHVVGLADADHAELNPNAALPLLNKLHCPLVEQEQKVIAVPGSPFREIYGADSATEGYHCNYGLNPQLAHLLENGPLQIGARSEEGEVRAVCLGGHPFFVGTLFQPERRALTGTLHGVVRRFFEFSCIAQGT
jgi:CTP synthase (UTP-ammonia lyase)